MSTFRQTILRLLYPMIRKAGKKSDKGMVLNNTENKTPPEPFYQLAATLNNNTTLDFLALAGKKVLIVNTASNCGYTGQYAELQTLHEQYRDKLHIIGFPANDFKEQEQGDDDEIAQFCQINYGVTFPLAKKAGVIKNAKQQPVFQWLTDPSRNGWNSHAPDWNFSKYLIDEKGNLQRYFGPAISPLDHEVLKAIE